MTGQNLLDLVPVIMTVASVLIGIGAMRQQQKAGAEALTTFGAKIDLLEEKMQEARDELNMLRGEFLAQQATLTERARWEDRRMEALDELRILPRSPKRTKR